METLNRLVFLHLGIPTVKHVQITILYLIETDLISNHTFLFEPIFSFYTSKSLPSTTACSSLFSPCSPTSPVLAVAVAGELGEEESWEETEMKTKCLDLTYQYFLHDCPDFSETTIT